MSESPLRLAEQSFAERAAEMSQLAKGLERDARALRKYDSEHSAAAAFAFALAALLEATASVRQATPAAFLAMIIGRLWHKHAEMSAEDATALLARMMAGEDRRDVLVNLATAAIDDWIGGQEGQAIEAVEEETNGWPAEGERLGEFEPLRGDEIQLEPLTGV